ncbi:MAG: hypothetical protein K6E72_08020 [Saccharofermentans sp.]|jgi:hypothetical protein|nr:hypothetical protein [Saccharofermentans sp.]
MENNNYQQPVYQQPQPPYQQPFDPNYAVIVKDFLTKAIVSCAISSLPVGSIIAINMASKNRKALLEYLDKGGLHTEKIKVCSALSRGGRYSGIGFTIFWGIYLIYFAIWIAAAIFAVIASAAGQI